MKKLLAPAIVLSLIGLSGSPALAANKEGAKCTTAGKIVTVSGKKLVCAKVAKTLKWVAVSGKAVTTTTVAPTTTVAATTTTTTIAVVKPVVTLLRAGGTSTSPSVNYTLTGDKDIDCTTLSKEIGIDFTTKNISVINSIVQTSAKVCTVNAQSRAERDNTMYETILQAADTFAISDTSGNVQTTLLGSPQRIEVRRAP